MMALENITSAFYNGSLSGSDILLFVCLHQPPPLPHITTNLSIPGSKCIESKHFLAKMINAIKIPLGPKVDSHHQINPRDNSTPTFVQNNHSLRPATKDMGLDYNNNNNNPRSKIKSCACVGHVLAFSNRRVAKEEVNETATSK